MSMVVSLILFSLIKTIGATLGLNVPAISSDAVLGIFFRLFYGIWLIFFLIFIFMRKFYLQGLQKQAIIMQGIYFGGDVCMESILGTYLAGYTTYISGIMAIISAVLSVNDKFMFMFMSLVNGFGVAYFCIVIFRIGNLFKSAIIFLIMYFVCLFTLKFTRKLQLCFAKIFTGSIAVISFVDNTSFISIFRGIHSVDTSTTRILIDMLIFLIVVAVMSAYFVGTMYFSEYTEEKIEMAKAKVATTTAT